MYYNNYKIELARKYLKYKKDCLNSILLQQIKEHSPNKVQLVAQFGLTPKIFEGLFFEEYGVDIFDYYCKLRASYAKELLNNQMKVYQVSESLGYSQPISFIHFFQKYEGLTPHQLVLNKAK